MAPGLHNFAYQCGEELRFAGPLPLLEIKDIHSTLFNFFTPMFHLKISTLRPALLFVLLGLFITGITLNDAVAQRRRKSSRKKTMVTQPAQKTPGAETKSMPANGNEKKTATDMVAVADLPKGTEPFVQPITREEKGQTKTLGQVNWSTQYIEATGTGIVDNERYKNPAQARAMAIRGATVVAQRNLLEIVKGVHVQGETTVEDMMTTRDFIVTRVDGIVKGAQPVGQPMERDGMVEVRLRMPLYAEGGLATAVYDAVPETLPTDSPYQQAETATTEAAQMGANVPDKGLAFQMNGKPFDPSLFPVVVDENGQVVLDMKKLYKPGGNFPAILKTTRDMMNMAGFKKGVELIDVIDAQNGQIKISNADAGKFPWKKILDVAAKVGKFLLLLI